MDIIIKETIEKLNKKIEIVELTDKEEYFRIKINFNNLQFADILYKSDLNKQTIQEFVKNVEDKYKKRIENSKRRKKENKFFISLEDFEKEDFSNIIAKYNKILFENNIDSSQIKQFMYPEETGQHVVRFRYKDDFEKIYELENSTLNHQFDKTELISYNTSFFTFNYVNFLVKEIKKREKNEK